MQAEKQAWRNVLLTDSGWYSSFGGGIHRHILDRFLGMLDMPAAQAKVLFIPTAANSDESRPAVGKCFAELLSAGIAPNNIRIYDIDGTLTLEQAMQYDAVYVTGGDPGYLLRRIKETGFDEILKKMVYANKVYVGASAGSLIATPNIGAPYTEYDAAGMDAEAAGLGLVNAYLSFHNPKGTKARCDLPLPHIPLIGGQALVVNWADYELIQ